MAADRSPSHTARDVLHDVVDEERTCGCGREKVKIGEDTTEQLDYIPGKLEVLRHIYPKYACSCCKDGVTAAPRVAVRLPEGWLDRVYFRMSCAANSPCTSRSIASRMSSRGQACSCAEHALRLDQSVRVLKPLVELMRTRLLLSHVINPTKRRCPCSTRREIRHVELPLALSGRYRSSLHGVRLPRLSEP